MALGSLGKLVPPYPVDECGNVDCLRPLKGEDDSCYVFRDLETDKLVIFCENCAIWVELNRRDRFLLVAL